MTKRRTREPNGTARLESVKGRLRVRFPAALCGGKPVSRSLGLKDTFKNRNIAQEKIDAINSDIVLGQFDPTLERYLPQSKQANYKQKVKDIYPDITLLSLWLECTEYYQLSVKETTWVHWKKTIEPWICKLPYQSPDRALEIRNWLLKNTTESMTKRVLGYLCKTCSWALKHEKIKTNPFQGLACELKHKYEKEPDPNPLSREQKEMVVETFREHQTLSYYTNFVEFLFLTGCRPEEAVGLTWGDIHSQYKYIFFDGGITYSSGKQISTKGQGSKNNRHRRFPCNTNLKAFLRSLHPKPLQKSSLVFPGPKGKPLNYNNFRDRIWKRIVDPIKPDTTPYSARDTFITEQISKGHSTTIVGQWTDNSTRTIEKYYLGESLETLPL